MREDVAEGLRAVLSELGLQASVTHQDDSLEGIWPGVLERAGPSQALRQALLRWCMADPRPLVLLIDEIDALIGDTPAVRAAAVCAPAIRSAPAASHTVSSCAACGTCATTASTPRRRTRLVLGGSAFNIKSKSLRLGDFTEAETRALLAQHTEATGPGLRGRRRWSWSWDAGRRGSRGW